MKISRLVAVIALAAIALSAFGDLQRLRWVLVEERLLPSACDSRTVEVTRALDRTRMIQCERDGCESARRIQAAICSMVDLSSAKQQARDLVVPLDDLEREIRRIHPELASPALVSELQITVLDLCRIGRQQAEQIEHYYSELEQLYESLDELKRGG